MVNLSRRSLFLGNVHRKKELKKVTKNTVLRTVARPPTAVDEDIFKRICNQCRQCEIECPEQVIVFKDGYPEVDVEYSACTLCGKCKTVCLTMALSGGINDIGLRVNISNVCINEYGYCDACRDTCSALALTWRDGKIPIIDTNQCNGCGLCKESCYIEAISLSIK
ncbi:4Fe-4S binding protein [Photobacterium kishitanii]|uniref:4Fe-4S binding protein n=1 Tax=Photobacterium kishitanii TaxID=318456 RepID=UPI0004332E7A|nr:4Fe-4S binding protein [Photobacterium kishitanii]CEO39905.1 putative ferredoxin-type protein NapF [Photobacterium kishitanii]